MKTTTAFIRCGKGPGGLARLICLLAFIFSLPAMADAASDLPAGFIALSEPGISWDKALG